MGGGVEAVMGFNKEKRGEIKRIKELRGSDRDKREERRREVVRERDRGKEKEKDRRNTQRE